MKKFLITCFMIVIVLALSIVNSSAIVHTITFDWEELGAKKVGTSATADDYFGVDGTGEKVHNLRCNYSQWDNAQEYLWVVSNWSKAPRQPAWIYLGKQDMSIIDTITFDYVSDGADTTGNKVSITKDKEGTQILATGGIPEPTGLLSNPINVEMEILDEDYEGDIYLYIEYESRFFVGNLVFTTEDDGTTPSPTPEPTPTPEKTATPIKTSKTTQVPSGTSSEGNYQIYIYIAVAVIVIIGAGVIFIIWKKK